MGKAKQLIDRWSSRYQWVQRCRLFDAYDDDRLREQNHRTRRDLMKRIATQALMMQKVAVNSLKRLGDNANLSPEETARFLDLGARLELRARGEPEDGDVANVTILVGKREAEPFRADLCVRSEVRSTRTSDDKKVFGSWREPDSRKPLGRLRYKSCVYLPDWNWPSQTDAAQLPKGLRS